MTATLTQLLHRRAVLGLASRRRRTVRVPSARAPSSAVMAYAHLARGVLAALDDALVTELREVGVVHLDAGADGNGPTLPAGVVDRVLRRLERVLRSALDPRRFVASLDTIAARTSAHSREEFHRQVKAALGIDLPAGEPNLAPKIADFRRANTDLIRSLAREKVERVRSILTDAGGGTRVETLAKRIREETDATPQRAALIARDQVLKLNAQVTQARHEAAGLTEYVWRTSKDERVRKRHKHLEGTRHRYDDPPVVDPRTGRRAHPGEWWRCRCVAEPLLPEWEGFPLTRTDAWNEAEHDRDKGGRFTAGTGGRGPLQAKLKGSSGPPKGQATSGPSGPAKPPHVAKAEADAARHSASITDPKKRKAFDDAVDALYTQSGHAPADVAHLVSGAVAAADRGVNPTEYLEDAHAIVSRPGLSPETVRCMGANAVGKHPWDLHYIRNTDLKDEELNFLAGDRDTPWPKWKRAADLAASLKKNPRPPTTPAEAKARESTMRQANLSIRGASAEFVAGQQVSSLVSGHHISQRQIPLSGKVLDYEITTPPPPRKRYMEVKGSTHDTWQRWLDCHQRQRRGDALSPEDAKAAAKIDATVAQMRAAASATHPGERPVLAVTSALQGTPALAALRSRLRQGGVDAEVVFVPENDIVTAGRRLRARLGFGAP